MADTRIRCVHPDAGEASFKPGALDLWAWAKGWRPIDESVPDVVHDDLTTETTTVPEAGEQEEVTDD
jgi:hypothetical protein